MDLDRARGAAIKNPIRVRSAGKSRAEGPERAVTVAFFGLFGAGNIGNEASLAAALASFRSRLPNARLVCIGADPSAIEAEHGVAAVDIQMSGRLGWQGSRHRAVRLILRPLFEVSKSIHAFRFLRVDAVIVPGTGILDDFGVRPQQMPFDIYRWTQLARLTKHRSHS